MAEIMARLQFENPSTFSARDEFDQTAGALTGKVAPVGGTWTLGTGDTDDFALDTANKVIQRTSTSDSPSTGRYVNLGTTDYTAVAVQADFRHAAATGTALYLNHRFGLQARYTDLNNHLGLWFRPRYNVDAGRLSLFAAVAGVSTTVVADVGYVGADWWTLRLVVDTAGRAFAWAFPQGGLPGLPVLALQHAQLVTGGTLATGKIGINDANADGNAAMRQFDNFLAFVPTVDAACFASQSLEYSHEGAFRENAAGTQWAEKTVSGRNLLIPCSGAEGRTPRIFIKGTRGDPDTMPDSGIDDIRATMRRLSWAAGAGLPRSTGFLGIHDECGPNPPLPTLDAALTARVEALMPVEGDPFVEDRSALMVA